MYPPQAAWRRRALGVGPCDASAYDCHSLSMMAHWASSGLTDIHHQVHCTGKDAHHGDHGTEEAPSPSVVYPGV